MDHREVPLSGETRGVAVRLRLLPGRLAVARLPGTSALPPWADGPGLVCITRRGEAELSITCAETRVPPDVRAERGWRAFEVEGPIDFQVVGLLHALSGPLARAGISLFAVATFDTDLLLVRQEMVSRAVEAFREAGHAVDAPGGD